MNLAFALGEGALLGGILGGSIGGIGSMISKDPLTAAKGTVTGALYGVALAAISLFAGQAAAIGAGIGLAIGVLVGSAVFLGPLGGESKLTKIFVTTLLMGVAGGILGYAGPIGALIFFI